MVIFENKWKAFKKSINKVSLGFHNLWFIMLGSDPNMQIVLKTLGSINSEMANIEEIWGTIVSHETSSNKAIFLYSHFMHFILNDIDYAFKLYDMMHITDKASALQLIKDNSKYRIKYKLRSQGIAYICVSTLINSKGIITDCNMATCKLLGRTKGGMMGKSMNTIIPNIYHSEHQVIINKFAKGEGQMLQNNVQGFLIHTSGYLVRVNKYIADYPSLLNTSQCIVVLDVVQRNYDCNKGCILTTNNYMIQGMTSELIGLIGVNNNMITTAPTITELFPSLNKSLKEQEISGVNCQQNVIQMNSKDVGICFTFSRIRPVVNPTQPVKRANNFEFVYSQSLNRFVRQEIHSECDYTLSKEDSLNSKKQNSALISITEKNIDSSDTLLSKLESCTSPYYQGINLLWKTIIDSNSKNYSDIKSVAERIVFS